MVQHYVKAKPVWEEYKRISGERPPYPRSKVALEQLRTALEELKREGKSSGEEVGKSSSEKQQSGSEVGKSSGAKQPSSLKFERSRWEVGKYLRGWEVEVPQGHSLAADPRSFLEGIRPQLVAKLKEEATALKGIKFQLSLKVELQKTNKDGVPERTTPVLRHRQEAVLGDEDVEEAVDRAIPNILELLEKWTQKGSGWVVSRVKTLWLDIANYEPLRGSSYIDLPKKLKDKQAIVNVQNKCNNCFRISLRAAKFPAKKNPQRPSSYPTDDGLRFYRDRFPHTNIANPKV